MLYQLGLPLFFMRILSIGLSYRLFGVRFLDFLLFFFSLSLVAMFVEGNDSSPEGFGSELTVNDLRMAQGFYFILARSKERVHRPPPASDVPASQH